MILALHGRARSGKDTVGRYLEERYGFRRYAFADPIRDALRAAFGLTDWHFDEGKELPVPPFGKSPRQMMQLFGTEFGRQLIHPACWLLVAEQKYAGVENLVITDCRFTNEAVWTLMKGGHVIEIVRPDAPRVATHSSENGIAEGFIGYTIRNEGSLEDLYAKVDEVMKDIGD